MRMWNPNGSGSSKKNKRYSSHPDIIPESTIPEREGPASTKTGYNSIEIEVPIEVEKPSEGNSGQKPEENPDEKPEVKPTEPSTPSGGGTEETVTP